MKKLNSLGPGLVMGIPTIGRPVSLDWALAFKGMNPPINFNVNFCIVKGQQVADARNAIAREAIKTDAKYLFFLGDDVICPPHTLRQLIFRMENNVGIDVVGGVYCSKSDPSSPLVFRENGGGSYWDWKLGEFFKCTGLGMDCTLIRTSIFSKISEPWFQTVDKDQFLDAIYKAEQWTEDLYFFEKLQKIDGIVYCDASVICEHVDVYNNKIYRLPKNSLPMRQKVVNGSKKVLIIGPLIELNESADITHCGPYEEADYRCSPDNLPFETDTFDWVIVTTPEESFKSLTEWKRISKDKVSVNCHPWINSSVVAELFGGKVDGTFIEWRKNVNTQESVQSDKSSDHNNVSVTG
jgi:hypothetical protein